MIRRMAKRRGKNYRQLTASAPAQPDDAVPIITDAGGNTVTVAFNRPVVIGAAAVPAWTDETTSKAAVSIVQDSPTTATVTLAGAAAAGNLVSIGQLDGAIRTPQGGYVQSGTYEVQ